MDILKLSNMENILLAVTSNLKKIYSYYYAAKEDGQLNIEWKYNFIGRIIRFVESSKDKKKQQKFEKWLPVETGNSKNDVWKFINSMVK